MDTPQDRALSCRTFGARQITREFMKSVVLLELNEVPFKVIDYFCRNRPESVACAMLERSSQFVTLCEDQVELDPWISWPTLHRGVNDERHGIYHLGQILTDADRDFPPIWRILAGHGCRVGVFGSVHSNQIPHSMSGYDFYVPDFFDDQCFAHPDFLVPFQRFNLGMTRRSARNVDTTVPWRLATDFLGSLPKLGLSLRTVRSVVRQVLEERREPRLRIRRRSLQAVLMSDVFFTLLKSYQPQFATFYTNHVAAAMHRYWNAAFPEDDTSSPMPEQWRRDYAPEILEAMVSFDGILGRLKAWADTRRDTIVIIATSMGQKAAKHDQSKGGFTIRNMDKFLEAMGLERSQYRLRPAMSPCNGVVVDADARDLLKSKLDQFSIAGKRFVEGNKEVYPLSYGIYDQNFFSLFTYFENYAGEHIALIGNQRLSFEDIGFGFFAHEDGVGVTANHVKEGALVIYDPEALEIDQRRLTLSTTEIAPALLEHFGVQPLPYMSQRTGLVRTALAGR
jgi:hypothetical protein